MPVAAVIGGVATIGGAILGADAQRDAADTASDAARDASRANIALARETYAQNAERLDPYAARGNTAGNAIMAILGFPSDTTPAAGGTGAPVGPEPAPPPYTGSSGLLGGFGQIRENIIEQVRSGQTVDPQRLARWGLTNWANQYQTWKGSNATGGQGVSAANAMSAFDTFRNSSAYQWRMDQGTKARQQGMGALGQFDSGATRKALTEYGQNFASNELGVWMDRLSQQQGMGLGAASALAGVSQNMATASMNANNNAAAAAGNAALIGGAATQNMYGQIAGALGGLASSFWPKG